MPKLSNDQLQAILKAAHADALASQTSSKLTDDRLKAMDYYNGDVPDMVAPEGRSKAVSMDVMETIEGLMPQLMDIFCGSDEVVKFMPVGPEDTEAAEQETDYVNHVFMQKNPGFLVLYSFIKDALMSKNGIVKIFWEAKEAERKETYYDLDDAQLSILLMDPSIEIIEHSMHPVGAY